MRGRADSHQPHRPCRSEGHVRRLPPLGTGKGAALISFEPGPWNWARRNQRSKARCSFVDPPR